eukprot:gnl/MRDRNA2_/MRDRNA2_108480_c0_seq1.p1 gnl/MRDRNA2_/MRDRNA2_108480_c0~~gnl/MRDRNA2_/MRDRNA2_108480_c0_seq1.p1  ORF type:complete len:165 (-),score=56.41 gnl/MRDRNA2_/MRDRNA2_108480_c0_seq1:162-656(-)
MSYKDIPSTSLHFTGKQKAQCPWLDIATIGSSGNGSFAFRGRYFTAAMQRMEQEEAEEAREKEMKIAEKLAKYKAQEEEIERQRQEKNEQRRKALTNVVADPQEAHASKHKGAQKKIEKKSKEAKKTEKVKRKKTKKKKEKKKKRKSSSSSESVSSTCRLGFFA